MMLTEKKSCEDIQKLMKSLVGYCPELEYQEPLRETDHEIKDALAKAYGEPGFRKYLQQTINVAKDNAAMKPGNLYQAMFARGRIEAFIEIYATSRNAFGKLLVEEKQKKTYYEKEQEKNPQGSGQGTEEEPASHPGEDGQEERQGGSG